MSPQIDIDDDVLDLLKRSAEPFTDTPNSVLRRLLGLEVAQVESAPIPPTTVMSGAAKSRKAAKRSGSKTPRGRTRAAAGTLLPEERYELPLLKALVDLGGQAPYRDVVEAVGKTLDSELTPADKDNLASGGVRWQSRLQFVRLRLIERGLLERDTPRGIWGVTDEGRAAVEKGQAR